jgi:DNA-binding transcriptional MerR regulator
VTLVTQAAGYDRPVSSSRRGQPSRTTPRKRAANGASADPGADSPNQLTIEQLAQETGMTVRNIRSHQARGLLAPPEVRLRVGYYGPEHVTQLRLIRELQDEGFNLNGIKRLLDDTKGTAERLLHFKESLTATAEAAETMTLADLDERFNVPREHAAEVLDKLRKLGVLRIIGDGVLEAPNPGLLAVAEQVVHTGISPKGGVEILEEVDKHCAAISHSFVRLFLREVWRPFQDAGMPAEQWPELDAAIERLRPLATEVLVGMFQQRMSKEIEGAFGEITRRLSQGKR